jgi:hypothetical protein
VVCIESLNVLAGKKDISKMDILIDFFNNKISVRDRQFILDNEPIAKLQALVTQGFRNTGKTTLPTKKM